jgi:hypothetical protein
MTVRAVPGRVKKHVKEHKEAYIVATVAAVAGGAVGYLVRAQLTVSVNQKIQSIGYKSTMNLTNNSTVNVIRADKGPLGNAVIRLSDGEQYRSQRDAALQNGISEAVLRHHLRGETPNAGGERFHILREAEWAA